MVEVFDNRLQGLNECIEGKKALIRELYDSIESAKTELAILEAQRDVVESLRMEARRAIQLGSSKEDFDFDDIAERSNSNVSVRSLVRATIAKLSEFNVNQFVFAVRSQEPSVKRNTILVELAAAAKRHEVERIKTGWYRRQPAPIAEVA